MTDRFNNTPLHAGVAGGNLDVVKFLVSKGANVNAQGRNSRTGNAQTPLAVARNSGNTAIVNYLRSEGGR